MGDRACPAGRLAGLVLVLGWSVACGGSSDGSPAPTAPSLPAVDYTVQSVTDGDTVTIAPTFDGATSARLLNIDAPEMNGDTQEPWAGESRQTLRTLLPLSTTVDLETDRDVKDTHGRLLAHVVRRQDRLNANRELLRQGQAVTYVIWPNVAHFEEYRAAQIEAQDAGRGIWNLARPLPELPYVYRLRGDGKTSTWPVGDYFSKYFVEGGDYVRVDVNNRVFFAARVVAEQAGYRPCPVGASGLDPACFSAGR